MWNFSLWNFVTKQFWLIKLGRQGRCFWVVNLVVQFILIAQWVQIIISGQGSRKVWISWEGASLSVSRISPKLLQTKPHIVKKPGDYNGTIIFEIDTIKKSSPINLNLCQTWLFHKCFLLFLYFWFTVVYYEAELRVNQKEGPIEIIERDPPNFTNLGDCFDFRPSLMSDFSLMSWLIVLSKIKCSIPTFTLIEF